MKRGFTLIELIIVVIIIGILAAVGIPQYMKAIEKARGAEGYAGLGYIQQGEKIYFANNEVYYTAASPMSAADQQKLDISLPQTGWKFGVTAATATTFTATATRLKGSCINKVMTINEKGVLTDTDWRSCQEAL